MTIYPNVKHVQRQTIITCITYKTKKTLPQECVSLWNTIPAEIKNIAYNITSTKKQFIAAVKAYLACHD